MVGMSNHDEHNNQHPHNDEHDLGLAYDLTRFTPASTFAPPTSVGFNSVDRRNFLKYAAFAGVAGIAVIGMRRSANASTTQAGACGTDVPEETAGPFPGDGTNGPNVLTTSGVVRQDIRTSFGSLRGTAEGVKLTVTLALSDAATCTPAAGYAVYAWHADSQGRYSLYSAGATDQNYCRGVQVADDKGNVTFTTVFPGCYDGRWPHIHFEVYPSIEAAGDASKRIATSQIALPKAACDQAYKTKGYESSPANLGRVSLATDGVFSDDGGVKELATVTGSVADGFVALLPVTVSNTVKASGGGPGGGPGGGQRPPRKAAPTTRANKRAVTTKKKSSSKKK
jgi:protocatechuate 3,4-dioxygenase beta subunit